MQGLGEKLLPVSAAAVAFGAYGVKAFGDFEQAMNKVKVKLDESDWGRFDELKEQALEMMEQSLAILYALQEPAAADLHDVIERVMGSSGKMGEEGEVWDSVFTDLPHLTMRALFLHRNDGFTVGQIARRLRISEADAAERLDHAVRYVRAPASPRI